MQSANYFGSITQSSTVLVGSNSATGEETFVPMKSMLPMVMIRVWEVTFESNLVTSYTPLVTVSSVTFQLQLHVYSRQEDMMFY